MINRKKSKFKMCTGGIHINVKIAKTVRQNEVYMSFWTKEWEIGSSSVDGKEQTFGKQVLAGLPRNSGTLGNLANRFLLESSLSATLISYVLR